MTPHRTSLQRLPFTIGRGPEAEPSPSSTWARGRVAMRRSWIITALFLLGFVAFWEVRTTVRLQPIVVSPAEVMQLAARGALATATVHKDHILLQRRSVQDGSLHARARAWVGLPIDGQLLVMRSGSAADIDGVRSHLAAHGVRILGKGQAAR